MELPSPNPTGEKAQGAFGSESRLAGFLAGGIYGLAQAWAFLSSEVVPVPGTLLPILAAGVVAVHAAIGALAFPAVALLARIVLPAAFRGTRSLPRLCAIACALTAGGERAAALLGEGEASLPAGLDALAIAAGVAILVGLAASGLSRHPPEWALLARVIPVSIGSGAFLLGTRGLVARSGGEVPSLRSLALLGLAAALLGGFAWILARRLGGAGAPRLAGRLFAGALAASLVPAAAAAILGGGSATAPPRTAAGRPPLDPANVLLVTVDTLRADAVGFSGKPIARTPNLDALAARGTVFENAFATSPWTFPSLASLFTSRHPSECGGGRTGDEKEPILHEYWRRARLDTSLPTLATALREGGYETAGVVTNVWLGRRFGFHRGFDRYVDATRARSWHAFRPLRLYRIARRFLPGLERDGTLAGRATSLALAELDRLGERPFFLWVHYFDPHLPYSAPGASAPTLLEIEDFRGGRFVPEEVRPKVLASYVAEVEYADREIGRLLDGLEERGLAERTLVVLTSDHGEEFWEHGGFEHGHTFHGEVTRVPLVVARRGGAGDRVAHPVSLLDVFPTVMSILGLPLPPDLEGRSLLDPEEGPRAIRGESLLYGPERRWVRTRDRLLVLDPRSGEIERFDLAADPGENARAPAGDGPSERLAADLRAWSESMLAKARAWRERTAAQGGDAQEEDWLRQVGYLR